jgi:DNA-binding transcriptional regulator GbsR (MarR family)
MAGARTPAQQFADQVGLRAEADGLPPIAGRLFAMMLLSPDPMSLDDIAAALQVSKGSASTDARLLLRHGWLRRVVRRGDRRDYYEMAPDFFAEIVAHRAAQWQALNRLVEDSLPGLGRIPPIARRRLQYLDEAQRFFLDGIDRQLLRWRHVIRERSAAPRSRSARR